MLLKGGGNYIKIYIFFLYSIKIKICPSGTAGEMPQTLMLAGATASVNSFNNKRINDEI